MNLQLTDNMTMDTETGNVTRSKERISIEFWDPSKKMNRCIIDRADRLTYQQLAVIADYQRELGRTELKIRRAGQFRPSGDELNKFWGRIAIPCNPECKFWKFPNLDRACVLSEVFSVEKDEPCYEFKKKEKGE